MEDGIPRGLQHCHETCCEKGGRRGRWAYRVQRWHHHGDVVFRTGGLAYDSTQDNYNLYTCSLLISLIYFEYKWIAWTL